MNNELTYIAVVLDRSGSMLSVKDATEEGLRSFIESQKQLPGKALMTLVQFDNEYEIHAWEKPLSDVSFTYEPRGGTALLDTLGKAIDDVGSALTGRPESERPGKVMFVIVTDGEENSSRKFTRQQVFDKITHQRSKYAWEFIFLGANQDAIAEATSLGMAAASSMTYTSNKIGTRSAFGVASASAGSYRTGMTKGLEINETQRNAYKTEVDNATAVPVTPAPTTPDNTGGKTP